MASETTPNCPSLMIVHPTLHDPSSSNASIFKRWTRLHYRDLLSLPASSAGRITHASRFINTTSNSHLTPPIFHTVLATDIPIWRTQPYYAVSRRLDLENTRPLCAGEEPVGCKEGAMVWDVCDARFTIYYEVSNGVEIEGVRAYQTYNGASKGKKYIIGIGCDASFGEEDVKGVQKGLVDVVNRGMGDVELYSGVYKHAEDEVHPDGHPKIGKEEVGGGEWLLLLMVVDGGGKMTEGGLERVVGEWVGGVKGKDIKYGVWECELDMS